MTTAIQPDTFVTVVRPLLESNDLHGLVKALQRWNCSQITRLVMQGDPDARKVALLCLAMVGERTCIETVQSQLADADPTINQMAEHALWSIWFRCSTPEANAELYRGSNASGQRKFDLAVEHFDLACKIDPQFAEPCNQRAIVRFMQERYEESIADCRKAIRLMPGHFGAWAGMGHCFLHLGQLEHARRAYKRALEINPHLEQIRETLAQLS